MARENEQGQNELCAYVVAEGELTIAQLRGELAQTLPSYMIPAHFVQLEQLPLTPNGKIDRKALPAPDGKLSTGAVYVAPRNEAEQALAEIWQALLKAERVGVHDNFFDLGGDSIKAIQVMSRLQARGMKLEMKHLFRFPALEDAARQITEAVTSASQETVEGEVALTPIQRWFFEASFTDAHHWNQSVMLHSDSGFDERIVRDVWTKLTGHHDALRTVYRSEAEGVTAWNRGLQAEGFTLTVMDLTEESDPAPRVEEEATRVQSSLNLSEGPLVGLGLFRTAEGDHLLIAIHHLVVDGVSWRILLEDFAQGYAQAAQGEAIMLPEKTTSYQAWSQGLQEYAQSKGLSREREYWSRMEELQLQPLPQDGIVNERLVGEMTSVSVELTEEETTRLVKEGPACISDRDQRYAADGAWESARRMERPEASGR